MTLERRPERERKRDTDLSTDALKLLSFLPKQEREKSKQQLESPSQPLVPLTNKRIVRELILRRETPRETVRNPLDKSRKKGSKTLHFPPSEREERALGARKGKEEAQSPSLLPKGARLRERMWRRRRERTRPRLSLHAPPSALNLGYQEHYPPVRRSRESRTERKSKTLRKRGSC